MKLNRREFIKRGGLLSLLAAVPGALKAGVISAKEHIEREYVVAYRKFVQVPIEIPMFDAQTGMPIVDLWLSIDHPRQRLACGCEYSLDGKCLKPCEEGSKLISRQVNAGAGLFSVMVDATTVGAQKAVDAGEEVDYQLVWGMIREAWDNYRKAEREYRQHYCTGWVGDRPKD